jgi:hypothetical protein
VTLAHAIPKRRVRRRDRCNQCNKPIDPIGKRNCRRCRKRLALHSKDRASYMASRPIRRTLSAVKDNVLRVSWVADSQNRKLGPIPSVKSTPTTCPPSCAFYGAGCYGEVGPISKHWRDTGLHGIGWAEMLAHVRALPKGQLWRYAEVGDLPGIGDRLHVGQLYHLWVSNHLAGARGFTFTHKPLKRADERRAIREANRNGFTINLSANDLADADRLTDLAIGPVAVAVPNDAPQFQRTPAGRHVIQCPATTAAALNCSTCGLCAIPTRKAIIGFPAHGQNAAMVNERARRLPVLQPGRIAA